ncbi:MAG TPA: ABC transporter permease, partial [Patescibacteria group bacterium]|nr:ABC transporter permease [Patescibacteria group bacterium]
MSATIATKPRIVSFNRRALSLATVYFAVAAIIVLVFVPGAGPGVQTTFVLNLGDAPLFLLPGLIVPSMTTLYLMAGVCAFCGALQLTRAVGAKWAILLSVTLIAFIFAFLTWTAADKSMNLVGVFQTSLHRAVPITFGALSGVLCERAGVVNIAIEGMLLSGAFAAAVVGSVTGNSWIGVIAAVLV